MYLMAFMTMMMEFLIHIWLSLAYGMYNMEGSIMDHVSVYVEQVD